MVSLMEIEFRRLEGLDLSSLMVDLGFWWFVVFVHGLSGVVLLIPTSCHSLIDADARWTASKILRFQKGELSTKEHRSRSGILVEIDHGCVTVSRQHKTLDLRVQIIYSVALGFEEGLWGDTDECRV
jgi:hypothetical protein